MTELEKKQAGDIYDARDPQLRELQNHAKDLMRQYNSTPAGDLVTRKQILNELLGEMKQNVRVNQPFYVDYGSNIYIGENSFVNVNCTLLDTGTISIGNNTLLGPDVKIYTAVHDIDGRNRFWEDDGVMAVKTSTKPVHIGDFVWIGGGVIILPGVTIGNYVTIGAGSVVTESIPDHAVACGNPCTIKYIREV